MALSSIPGCFWHLFHSITATTISCLIVLQIIRPNDRVVWRHGQSSSTTQIVTYVYCHSGSDRVIVVFSRRGYGGKSWSLRPGAMKLLKIPARFVQGTFSYYIRELFLRKKPKTTLQFINLVEMSNIKTAATATTHPSYMLWLQLYYFHWRWVFTGDEDYKCNSHFHLCPWQQPCQCTRIDSV